MATGNQYNTLTDLLKAIANAIRSKVGDVGLISAQDFPTNIASISTVPTFELISSATEIQVQTTYTLTSEHSKYSKILVVTCGGNNDNNTNTAVSASSGTLEINNTHATPYVSYRSAIGGMTIAILSNWESGCVLTLNCGFWGAYSIYGIK